MIDRIKWRFYSGAVLMGIGRGCMFLGKRWWAGDMQYELDARNAAKEGRKLEPKHYERWLPLDEEEIAMGITEEDDRRRADSKRVWAGGSVEAPFTTEKARLRDSIRGTADSSDLV